MRKPNCDGPGQNSSQKCFTIVALCQFLGVHLQNGTGYPVYWGTHTVDRHSPCQWASTLRKRYPPFKWVPTLQKRYPHDPSPNHVVLTWCCRRCPGSTPCCRGYPAPGPLHTREGPTRGTGPPTPASTRAGSESELVELAALADSPLEPTNYLLYIQLTVIYIYYDHPLSTAMAFHSHSNSHSQSYHSLDGATILSWAHDPDCQHIIACDTIEEGSLNH